MNQRAIPAVWMRGGTSKGLFFHTRDLPAENEATLLRAIGSPDPFGTQIDGLGGATSSTSKVVLIAPSERPDADVDYRFGHVGIGEPVIDWSGNCGNLTAAVGPFAIDEGLLEPSGDTTTVRIWQANLGTRIIARVPVDNGVAAATGDCTMDGVAFPGAPIELIFEDAGGEPGGGILPTGRAVDRLEAPNLGTVDASLIHAGNVAAFVHAVDLGLNGTETPAELAAMPETLARLNTIRDQAAVAMGLVPDATTAALERPATPKIHIVGAPADHTLRTGRRIAAADVDVCARALSMGQPHHAYPGTSAVATAVAAALPGTVVHDACADGGERVRIGHAAGVIEVGAKVQRHDNLWTAPAVTLTRTARRLMRGEVFIPAA